MVILNYRLRCASKYKIQKYYVGSSFVVGWMKAHIPWLCVVGALLVLPLASAASTVEVAAIPPGTLKSSPAFFGCSLRAKGFWCSNFKSWSRATPYDIINSNIILLFILDL